jgi:hypothetical protein
MDEPTVTADDIDADHETQTPPEPVAGEPAETGDPDEWLPL